MKMGVRRSCCPRGQVLKLEALKQNHSNKRISASLAGSWGASSVYRWTVAIICLICGCYCRIKAMTTTTKGSELLMTQGSYRDGRDWGIGLEVK